MWWPPGVYVARSLGGGRLAARTGARRGGHARAARRATRAPADVRTRSRRASATCIADASPYALICYLHRTRRP